MSPECACEISAQNITDHLLYHFENAYFVWNQKQAVFVHISLNANYLLLPALFSRTGLCHYSSFLRSLTKKQQHLFDLDNYVYHTEIMSFKAISV